MNSSSDSALDDLFEFLRFPSISADARYKSSVDSCADWLSRRLEDAGLDVKTYQTPGNPVVIARNKIKAERKTVMIYGHYDVQPVDPENLWTETEPFEPIIKHGRIFARGSADNKGQIFAHIAGVEKTIAEDGDLPVNLIVFVEGEEEVGSPNLEAFLQEHRSDCECEIIAVSDSGMVAAGTPTFAYGLRGICCLEVRLTGPAQDLHSGIFGGSVANPATVLSRMIASLHDKSGKITVPGFYDRVLPIQSWERELWQKLPFDKANWLSTTGSPALAGENGYTFLEHVWARPTAEVNGFVSGYQGEGPKTIVPSRATAKLSFRLVPRQDPQEIKELVTEFLKAQCPPSVMMEIVYQHQGKPYLVEPSSSFGMAAQRALMQTFDKPVALVREGGSIPITQTFKDLLGADTLLLGLALPDSRVHSPNENLAVENFYAGMRLNRHLLEQIAKIG